MSGNNVSLDDLSKMPQFQLEVPEKAPLTPSQRTAEKVGSIVTGLSVAFLIVNYFAISGTISSGALLAGLNISLSTLIILGSLYCFAKQKTRNAQQWQELAKKILFFAFIFTGSMIFGVSGMISTNPMGWLNLSPLLAVVAYKGYKAFQSMRS